MTQLSEHHLQPIQIKITVENNRAIPKYASSGAAGADLIANIEEDRIVSPGERILIPTGVKMEIPSGYEVQIRPRSGLALRHGITLLNSPGTIDSDYRGEIAIILINHGQESFTVTPGMRIAQMIVARVEIASFLLSEGELEITARGSSGFGHTGTH